MAEGAPLLREYGVYSLIEGSNPSLSARNNKTRFARPKRPSCRFVDPGGAAHHPSVLSLSPQQIQKKPRDCGAFLYLAEREGFEPSMGFLNPYSLSRGAPSATRPPLRNSIVAQNSSLIPGLGKSWRAGGRKDTVSLLDGKANARFSPFQGCLRVRRVPVGYA